MELKYSFEQESKNNKKVVVDLYVIRIQCVVRNLHECANVCIYCARACETTRYLILFTMLLHVCK